MENRFVDKQPSLSMYSPFIKYHQTLLTCLNSYLPATIGIRPPASGDCSSITIQCVIIGATNTTIESVSAWVPLDNANIEPMTVTMRNVSKQNILLHHIVPA